MGESSNFQTGPIVYHGVMYVTTTHKTVALDATTGAITASYAINPTTSCYGVARLGTGFVVGGPSTSSYY